jgi:hypothetical protein
MTNRLKDFVEQQEVLDNIKTALKGLYHDDPEIEDDDYINDLTESILKYMKYMGEVYDDILEGDGMDEAAEKVGISKKTLASNIVEVLLFSTLARQNMVIDELRSRLN